MAKPEGKYFKFNSEDDINSDFLETFPFDSPNQYIMTETDEFSAVCPFSGLPDMAYVKIEYFPKGGKCIELKSLKYYLLSYRSVGIVQEHAANRILKDLVDACDPEWMRITLIYNVRGGMETTVLASHCS